MVQCRARAPMRTPWLILVLLCAPCLHAQPAPKTGTLAGTVFDAWGDPVPLAEVTLIDQDGLRRSLITGQTGRYFARDLAAGSYSLVVTSPALGEHTSTAIVKEGQIVDVPVVLT